MNRRKAIQLTALAIAGLPAVVRAKTQITDGNYWHFPIGDGRLVGLRETWERRVFAPDLAGYRLIMVWRDDGPSVTWIRTWTRVDDDRIILKEAFEDNSEMGRVGSEAETLLTSLLLAPESPYPVMLVAGGFGL